METPADRVAALRAAFMAAMKDPDLVGEANKMQVDADPVSGEDLQKKVEQIFATPADIVEKTRKAVSD
jgi:tripartite-type tricarboxylate transporter receptor subunit TctC